MEGSVNVICYINEFKNRYHISIDPEKALTKKQLSFMMKTMKRLGMEETFLKTMEVICDKPVANIILNGENHKAFSLRSETRQGCPLYF